MQNDQDFATTDVREDKLRYLRPIAWLTFAADRQIAEPENGLGDLAINVGWAKNSLIILQKNSISAIEFINIVYRNLNQRKDMKKCL
ncbi:hypothetical protein [Mycoplasmopsis gallinarum]|uniref:Uncharacterized protein n=1 Tax=Mycoplasmopsis gallinarum TaxID=29557 RepID=A0A168R6E2_9BACT|nr:hypothetical protein [Mycoplasmopsis gallinarum]OAB48642.1 hypothetical protein MGALLINA_06080 [Mycoplasmopsis gallinarum]